jgi:hypothetical protein
MTEDLADGNFLTVNITKGSDVFGLEYEQCKCKLKSSVSVAKERRNSLGNCEVGSF